MIFIIIFLSYLFISCIFDINHDMICFLCFFFLFKWIFNYRKCTVSYIECKLRGVKKEEGYVNYIVNEIIDINKWKYKYIIYLFTIFVFIVNFKKIKSIK